jgi:hypothetical protein
MAERKAAALELAIRAGEHGADYSVRIDGAEVGADCTKLVLTVTPEGTRAELTLLVEDVTVPKTHVNVICYRVCAQCSRELASEEPPPEQPAGPY